MHTLIHPQVQLGAVALDDRLAPGVLPPEKLHVTLLTLRIDTEDERAAAEAALHTAAHLLASYFPHPSRLALERVDTFRDRVMHATLSPADHAAVTR